MSTQIAALRAALARLTLTLLALVVGLLLAPIAVHAAEPIAMERNALATETSNAATNAVEALQRFLADGDPEAFNEFTRSRTSTARLAARQLGYDEFEMIRAWRSAPLSNQHAVLAAMSQVGVPYRSNAISEGVGFDCSGLTTYAWGRAGVSLYHQSGRQIGEAEPRERATAQAGDLIHYPGHVMMYLGVDDAIIHAVQTGRTVEVDTISARRRDTVSWGAVTTEP